VKRPILRAGDWVRLSAERDPRQRALVLADGSALTYAELNARVNRMATALRAEGVGKGDRVAVLALDSPGYLETLLAAMKLGAVHVALNNKLTMGEVRTLAQRAQPTVLAVDDRYAATAAAVRADVPAVRTVVSLDGDGSAAGVDVGYAEFLAAGTDTEPDVRVEDDDILGLAFTSGTTGLPKGVLQSQGMLKAMVASRHLQYDIRDDDFRYGASPLFHIAGQVMLISQLARGIPNLLLPRFDVDTVLRWLAGGRITACFLVPTMISALLDHPEVAEGDFGGLRLIVYGAAPMTPALLRRAIERFDCDFINAFGAGTEAGLQTILTMADHRAARAGRDHLLGSIGRPSMGVDLRLVDDDGKDVADGEIGQIVTRSDTVMSGYLDMPEETERSFRDGWFWAGDLARRDAEGYLYLSGRAKDMVIRGGENIYPVEIEAVLAEHPAVVQSAVVGAADERWGEVVVAFVEIRPGADVLDEELRAHCRGSLAPYKVPVRFVRLPELPRNASGKILKGPLRQRLAEGADGPSGADALFRGRGAVLAPPYAPPVGDPRAGRAG
jgi:acyl-CoA synthetase (AMP-forming)/AMP-acid ligase II